MTLELIIAVVMFAASTSITPGPNNIMIMSSGLNYGIRRSLPHFFGIGIGFPFMLVAVGFGFSAVFEHFPFLHPMIKLIGISYLLYLAWKIARAAPSTMDVVRSEPLTFLQACLFQWVNPKAWVVATGAIAVYTTGSYQLETQVVMIALAFFLVAFPCIGCWLFFGVALQRVLQDVTLQRMFNIAMAILLVLSVMPMTYDTVMTGVDEFKR